MGIINILTTDVSNKIAAGEVVERPASVIKELVENSIDAGAKNITVEIKNGGITYMRVADDGVGMSKEDASIAFLRHATSKIKNPSDLDAIYTLGFRGEALSSVAAVAHIDCFTKRREDETGTYLHIEDAAITDTSAAGVPNGTTITVQRLFYNTPARMKFLKKDATEAGYISSLMERFVLAHPNISFKFINNGKEVLFSAGDNNLLNAIYVVYGKDYARSMINVDYDMPPFKVTGYVGKADVARPNRNMQHFFVNTRSVKSAMLIKAAEEAYKNQLMGGKFPVLILNISLNPSVIDINVHPTKMEVKFANERQAYEAVYFAVKNALFSTAPYIEKTQNTKSYILNDIPNTAVKPVQQKMSEPVLHAEPKVPAPDKLVSGESVSDKSVSGESVSDKSVSGEPVSDKSADKADDDFVYPKNNTQPSHHVLDGLSGHSAPYLLKQNDNNLLKYLPDTPAEPTEKDSEATVQNDSILNGEYRYVGSFFNTYLILELEGSIALIDQHAAHERIRFEKLKESFKAESVATQLLLTPITITLTKDEFVVFTDNKSFLNKLGFDAGEFGTNDIIVRSVPMNVNIDELTPLVIELITMLADNKQETLPQKTERMLYTIACKSAVKAGDRLGKEEITALLDSLKTLNTINTCPHGRPIMITLTKYEVEKMFKRII